MARPKKKGVDYFPHDADASDGRTLRILEQQFQNDGYAFWFKLLELLGKQDGHSYNCTNPASLRYLAARANMEPERTREILETLAELDAIDAELWACGVIWVQSLVDRLADVYAKRKAEPPQRPEPLVDPL